MDHIDGNFISTTECWSNIVDTDQSIKNEGFDIVSSVNVWL